MMVFAMRLRSMLGRIPPVLRSTLLVLLCVFGLSDNALADRPLVLVATIEGPIGPATVHHVRDVLHTAEDRGAVLLVFRINTPGGLATSMREIVNAIMSARVPIAGYVAPPGAHAASAGTYILYAMPIAAMAPGTNLGAATPVQIGGMPGLPEGGKKPGGEQENGKNEADGGRPEPMLSGSDAMTAKATNDAVAFIRSLAEVHGRNADWAERAVREAASLSAKAALEENVIDLVADDMDALLAAIDGRVIKIGKARHELSTKDTTIETVELGAITRLLGILSNPNIAFVLMMVGVYGLILEFLNPGSIVPGVVGAISLILGLFALNQLPLDYAGLALLALGVAFMVAEAITPTFGILGFGGLVAFIIGSLMLIDTDIAEYQISWWLIGTMAAASAAILILLVGVTWRSYRRAPAAASNLVVGAHGRVLDWSGNEGHVWAQSERWQAEGPIGLGSGRMIRVTGIRGLTLIVAPAKDDDTAGNDVGRTM